MGAVSLSNLRSVRRALGVSQSEFAALLDISPRAVQSYEQGWRVTPAHVQRLSGLLLYLDWRRHGPAPPCWQATGCDERRRRACPAYVGGADEVGWMIAGNPCLGRADGDGGGPLGRCERCPVMRPWLAAR